MLFRSPEQEKALTDMLGGDLKAWGPKARHLAGEFKGVKRVPITYTVSADKMDWAAKIPGILDLKVRAHVNPGHKNPAVSTGIMIFTYLVICANCKSRRTASISVATAETGAYDEIRSQRDSGRPERHRSRAFCCRIHL